MSSRLSFRLRVAALAIVAAAAIGGGLAGCRAADAVVVNPDGSRLLWSVNGSAATAVMDTGTTMQLDLASLYPNGDTIAGTTPTFTSSSPTKVSVSSTGLVTAIQTVPSVNIIGSVTVNGVTLAETTLVAVTAGRKPITGITLGVDSIALPLGGSRFFSPYPVDANGDEVDAGITLPAQFRVLDDQVTAFLYGNGSTYGYMRPRNKGTTRVIATSIVYGQLMVDTATITVINPVKVSYTWYGAIFSSTNPKLQLGSTNYMGVGGFLEIGLFAWTELGGTITFLTGADSIPGNVSTIGVDTLNADLFKGPREIGPFTIPGTYKFFTSGGDTATFRVIE